MSRLTLVLQGGLGNQLYQLFSAMVIADKGEYELFIDDVTLFNSDLQFRRVSMLNIFTTLHFNTRQIAWPSLVLLKLASRLRLTFKPLVVFNNKNHDVILRHPGGDLTMMGYFQDGSLLEHFSAKEVEKNIKKLTAHLKIDQGISDIAIHLRHHMVDSKIDDSFYIEKLRGLDISEYKVIYISAERQDWKFSYQRLENFLLDMKANVICTCDLKRDVDEMLAATVFIPARSTLSDWISILRAVRLDEYSALEVLAEESVLLKRLQKILVDGRQSSVVSP